MYLSKAIKEISKTNKKDSRLTRLLRIRAARLRTWRTLNGFSQCELADMVRVHPNTISNWEKGTVIPSWALEQLKDLGWPANETIVS